MTHKATSLIKRLLDVNDKTRLGSGPNGAKDIKAHPFFDGTSPCIRCGAVCWYCLFYVRWHHGCGAVRCLRTLF
jgi:hypothetical protein